MIYYKFRYYLWLKRQIKTKNTIFLVGTPVHENIGDAAIAYSELEYLKEILPNDTTVVEINQNQMIEYLDVIKKVIKKDMLILLHGGGNMGDEWSKEENDRRKFMNHFSKNRMIIMPQTIFYKNENNFLESKEYYKKFDKLTIVARELESYKILKENYSNDIILTPDIVLILKNISNNLMYNTAKKEGCLTCYRNDNEISMTSQMKSRIEKILSDKKIIVIHTDMINDGQIFSQDRFKVIKAKLKEISNAQLVITDRLHCMVFCYLTQTPCIVFSNYNHKVIGTYEWIKDVNYIELANIDNMEEQIDRLMKIRIEKKAPIIDSNSYNELEMRILNYER